MMKFLRKYPPGIICFSAFTVFLPWNPVLSDVVIAESLYVKKSGTKLRAEGTAKSAVVKVLDQGTPVEVKEKSGKFYNVSTAGAEGYVFKFKLTNKKSEKKDEGGGLLDVLGESQKIASKEANSISSIRGVSPLSEDHAKKNGMTEESIQGVKKMEEFNVSSQEVEQFIAQRKLGEYSD